MDAPKPIMQKLTEFRVVRVNVKYAGHTNETLLASFDNEKEAVAFAREEVDSRPFIRIRIVEQTFWEMLP